MTFGFYFTKRPRGNLLRTQGGINVGDGHQLHLGQTVTKQGKILSPWWRAVNYKVSHLQTRYGLPLEQAERIVRIRENGTCEICGEISKLCVDHDHKTGEIRGLICHRCNNLLIGLESDLFSKLTAYLKNYSRD